MRSQHTLPPVYLLSNACIQTGPSRAVWGSSSSPNTYMYTNEHQKPKHQWNADCKHQETSLGLFYYYTNTEWLFFKLLNKH
jgi:hypothetical protein